MEKLVSKIEFEDAQENMNTLLEVVTQKGGFDKLSEMEKKHLERFTRIVNIYEEANYVIPLPETLKGLLELKMYENKLKQKI